MRAVLLAVGLVALCAVAGGGSTAAAAVGAPFPCNSSTIFVAQSDPTQLEALVYGSGGGGSFQNIGAPVSPRYNAIAFNGSDHYIYAININGHLLQIDSTGAATDNGLVGPLAGGFVNNGAIHTNGHYYVMRSVDQTLYDVSFAPPAAFPIPLSDQPATADFASVGGFLWGQLPGSNALIRIDPISGQVTRFATTFIPPSVAAGAAWTYGNGDLGLSDNNSGTIYQVRITNAASATPTFTLISTRSGPGSALNDGTSCIGLPADLSMSKSGPATTYQGGTITWTLTVHNGGPGDSSGWVVTDTVPSSVSNVSSPTPGCSVSGNTFTCTGGALPAGGNATITLQGTVNAATGTNVGNTACVTGNEDDPNRDNNCSTSTSNVRAVLGLCRGTALRTGDLLVLSPGLLFGTANEKEAPCVTEIKHTLNVPLPNLHVYVLSGSTRNGATSKQATSSVAGVDLVAGANLIHIGAVESLAEASLGGTCTSINRRGVSDVANLTINGRPIVVGSDPLTIPLPGLGAIYINETVLSGLGTTVTQRGVRVDLPGTSLDVTIAESKAGIACAPVATAPARVLAVSRKGARKSARRMRAARL